MGSLGRLGSEWPEGVREGFGIVVSILSRHGMSEGFRVKGRYCPWRTQKEVVEDKKRDIGRLAVMEMRRSGWTNVGMTEDDDGMDQQVRDLL